MEGDKGGIFIKALDQKSLLLLKVKVKQNLGCPNKEYNTVFKHIHRNFRAYSRSKKNCIDQWLWKYCKLKESKQIDALVNKFSLFQIQLEGLGGGVAILGNFCKFCFHLSLETVFPAQKSCINMNISFSWNWQFNHILDPPLSFTNILCLKDYPHNLTKYEIKGTSKIPISQFYSKLRKLWKSSLGLY